MTSRKSKEPCMDGVEAFVLGMTSEVNATDVGRMMLLQQHMYVTQRIRSCRGIKFMLWMSPKSITKFRHYSRTGHRCI